MSETLQGSQLNTRLRVVTSGEVCEPIIREYAKVSFGSSVERSWPCTHACIHARSIVVAVILLPLLTHSRRQTPGHVDDWIEECIATLCNHTRLKIRERRWMNLRALHPATMIPSHPIPPLDDRPWGSSYHSNLSYLPRYPAKHHWVKFLKQITISNFVLQLWAEKPKMAKVQSATCALLGEQKKSIYHHTHRVVVDSVEPPAKETSQLSLWLPTRLSQSCRFIWSASLDLRSLLHRTFFIYSPSAGYVLCLIDLHHTTSRPGQHPSSRTRHGSSSQDDATLDYLLYLFKCWQGEEKQMDGSASTLYSMRWATICCDGSRRKAWWGRVHAGNDRHFNLTVELGKPASGTSQAVTPIERYLPAYPWMIMVWASIELSRLQIHSWQQDGRRF